MSEELDKIRAELERNLKMGNFHSDVEDAREGARMCLDLLDEYERKLVKIEGVETAHDTLREGKRAKTGDEDAGWFWLTTHPDHGRAMIEVIQPNPDLESATWFNPEQLEQHIAQCIAALQILKGKEG